MEVSYTRKEPKKVLFFLWPKSGVHLMEGKTEVKASTTWLGPLTAISRISIIHQPILFSISQFGIQLTLTHYVVINIHHSQYATSTVPNSGGQWSMLLRIIQLKKRPVFWILWYKVKDSCVGWEGLNRWLKEAPKQPPPPPSAFHRRPSLILIIILNQNKKEESISLIAWRMGNCVFKGFGQVEEMIKVVTSNGGIMELYAPITAENITNEFPGHAIFRSPDLFSQPLLHSEELHAGELYYLLPQNAGRVGTVSETKLSDNTSTSSLITPYRMSFDNQGLVKRSYPEVFPRYSSTGVWKVKLVISPEQLSEILLQESRTEALIESVRTVAKCGNGVSSMASSDQWSVASSWKGSSEKNGGDV